MKRTFNVYGLYDEKDNKVFEGTRDDFMEKYGINRNSIYSYLRNKCKINGLYEIRIIDKIVKDTSGQKSKRPKRVWEKGWSLDSDYDYLLHHIKYYGNTISNFDPNPYLSQLHDEGYDCIVKKIQEQGEQKVKGRRSKPKVHYYIEVAK